MPNYSNRNKLDALSEQAGELVQEINKLNSSTGTKLEGVDTKIRRNQRMTWLVGVSLIAVVIVTVVLTLTVISGRSNTEKIDKVTQRLDISQNVTRQKVLCPLYQLFVDSKSDAGRRAYQQGPEEYDRVYKILEDSYNFLKCVDYEEKS